MELTINSDIAKKYKLTMSECLIIYLAVIKTNIKNTINELISRKLLDRDLFENGMLVPSNNTKELISSIIIDSSKEVIDKDEQFIDIAKSLQELYPRGKKPGTNYMWRCTVAEVAKKLKILVTKYHFNFTKEQAIKATKDYIQSFNGDYTRMRLLKYFILKAERDADGNTNIVSDLMTLIENEGQEEINNEWTTKLV